MSVDRVRAFFAEEDEPSKPRHGRFELVREIGRGGSGTVHEAFDPHLKRRIALKVITGGNLERLRREAEAAARLRHPNVVTVFEVGPDYLAMELVEGHAGVPDLPALLTVAKAVAHAHGQGVVHRDLKPANVMVADDGRIALTDFGLARIEGGEALTQTGAVAGTPVYMAPEQVRGETSRIGPRTDVWALGVMLYEIASGRLPFDGETPAAVYEAILRDDPRPLEGPVGAVAARALDKDPGARYPHAGAFAADLERHLTGQPVEATAPGATKRLIRRVKRNPVPAMAFAAIGLAVAGAVALQLWMSERARAGAAFGEQARTALAAALDLRRAGATSRMRTYLTPLEKAYKELEGRRLAEVEYLMGRMHRALNDDERALEFQARALECDPEFAPALYERTLVLVRRWLAAANVDGDFDLRRIPAPARSGLEADLEGVIASKALSAAERSTAEGFLRLLASDRGAASESFRRASTADPQLEEAREGLGAALALESLSQAERKEAAWADAEALYTKGIEKDKGYVAHYMARGQLRWSRGSARRHRGRDPMPDYTAAEADFAKATELAPAHVDAWTWRGQMKVYQGIYALEMGWDPRPRLDAAEPDFEKALAISPKWGRAWMWRGNGRYYRGLWMSEKGLDARETLEAAEKDLGESIDRTQNANHERRWRGRIRTLRGTSIAQAGGAPAAVWAAAEDDFRRCEERDAWHHTWWAGLERARGDLGQAEARLAKALEINPSFDEAFKLRGLVRWDRKDYAGAASDLHQALAINPNFQPSIGDLLDRARRKSSE